MSPIAAESWPSFLSRQENHEAAINVVDAGESRPPGRRAEVAALAE